MIVLVLFGFLTPITNAQSTFVRGDLDQNGLLQVTDAIVELNFLFLGRSAPDCVDSADANDDGRVDLSDPLAILSFLFRHASPLPAPFPDCGVDPTRDDLGCFEYTAQPCLTLERPVEAYAPSNHFVRVTFDRPVSSRVFSPLAYELERIDGEPLPIFEARPDPDDARAVLLATGSQQSVRYELSLTDDSLEDDEGGAGAGGGIEFQGSEANEPRVVSAISLGSTDDAGTILLTFNEGVDEGALDARFYELSPSGTAILSAEFSSIGEFGTTVELTTEPQRNISYTIRVTNVRSRRGSFIVDPTRNQATFLGVSPVDVVPPRLLSAVSTSNTSALLSFSEPLQADSANPSLFAIEDADGDGLAVTTATLTRGNTQILLTTMPQAPLVEYTVTALSQSDLADTELEPVRDLQQNPIDVSSNSATLRFVFEDSTVPSLESAVSIGATEVLLTFSEPMGAGLGDINSYRIANPALGILDVTPSADRVTAVLDTTTQSNTEYRVDVSNVRSQAGGFLIDSERSSATFFGTTAGDSVPPALTGAISTSSITVLLSFSEPLSDDAADPTKYSIVPEISGIANLGVVEARLSPTRTQVLLTTLPQLVDVIYTVRVTGVTDRAVPVPNEIDPTRGNTWDFTFSGAAEADSSAPLRILGAVSTGNDQVAVTFNRSLTDEAEDPARYVITQETVNPEAGALGVRSAAFRSNGVEVDYTTVVLTTLSQNEITYRVTAVGLRDIFGNRLATELVIDRRLVTGNSATFPGTPPSGGSFADTDGDGLTDNEELRGWRVTVELFNGDTVVREVTSDPLVADTDGDEVDDLEERRRGSDPRNTDTDFDRLGDYEELNVLLSDPNDQDTDDDGLDDQDEVDYFKTNLNLADSDGDGFDDADEIFEMNRDPRIADLPRHGIVVRDVVLRIDERFTFVDENGETVTETSSTSTTLGSETASSLSRGDSRVASIMVEGNVRGGIGETDDFRRFIQGSLTVASGGEFTTETTQENARAASRALETSLEKGRELSDSSSVTREVVGASIDATVMLENQSDVAFSIGNLELSVLATDPQDRDRLVPVASLLPSSTLTTGEPAVFNLGPFDLDRGPIVFQSREVFPALVEDLLRDPRGLIFRVVNFDVIDEFERNFVFSSQVARDRTAGLVVDFGDGTVERHLVSTGPARVSRCHGGERSGELCGSDEDCPGGTCETEGIVGGFVGFSGTGVTNGLPLDYVLQDILGMEKNGTVEDAIVAGDDRIAQSIAQGDDIQLIPVGTNGLQADDILIVAGENGVLDTVVSSGDEAIVATGYATMKTCGPGSSNPGAPCDGDEGCDGGSCDGPEILTRFKNRRIGDFGRFWAIIVPELPLDVSLDDAQDTIIGTDFGRLRMRPGQTLGLAFVRDDDRDGLTSQAEFLFGSKDDDSDSDDDGLGDFTEVKVGWMVDVAGSPLRRVFSDPANPDSDGDGLTDLQESDLRDLVDELNAASHFAPDVDALVEVFGRDASLAFSTDPRRADTDADLVSDFDEVVGYLTGGGIVQPGEGFPVILAGDGGTPDDPSDDGLADTLVCPPPCDDIQVVPPGTRGLHPRTVVIAPGPNGTLETVASPRDHVVRSTFLSRADTRASGDDRQFAAFGEVVEPGQAIIKPGVNGRFDSLVGGDDVILLGGAVSEKTGRAVSFSSPLQRDHDSDAIFDGLERILGTDPEDPSDGDDFTDSDRDGLTDNEETTSGWVVSVPGKPDRTVFSNPSVGDTDGDGLPDLLERAIGSDPTTGDTDCDTISDFDEVAAEIFDEFVAFNDLFRGFHVDGRGSRQLGTDPVDPDSDDDALDDNEELEGYIVNVPRGTVTRVITDPNDADSDDDFIPDGAEKAIGTNALVADTDADGRVDGEECCPVSFEEADGVRECSPDSIGECESGQDGQSGSDPLVPEIRVRVTYASITASWSNNALGGEWWWQLFVQKSNQSFPGELLSYPRVASPGCFGLDRDSGNQCCRQSELFLTPLNNEIVLTLKPGEGFLLHGIVAELNLLACAEGFRVRIGEDGNGDDDQCAMTLPLTSFRYEELIGSGFTAQELQLSKGNSANEAGCEGNVVIMIAVE